MTGLRSRYTSVACQCSWCRHTREPACAHDWHFDGYFWHRCTKCGAVS